MNKTNFSTIEFENTSGNSQRIEFSFTTQCEGAGVISVSSKPSWLNSSVSGKIVTLTTNSSTTSQRSGNVIIAVDGVACDSDRDKIPVVQKAPKCSCGSNNFSSTSLTWTKTSTSPQDITYSIAGGCLNVTSVTPTVNPNNHFSVDSSTAGKITVTPAAAEENEVNGKLLVKYKANGIDCTDQEITLKHNGSGCGCGTSNFNPQSLTWPSNSTEPQDITYSVAGDCPINVIDATTDNTTHFSVSKSNGKITVTPLAQGGQSGVDAHLKITYKANGRDCDNAQLNLKHNGSNCGCGTFKFDSEDMLVWENDEALTPKTKGYTPHDDAASCITEIVPSVKENSHFNVVKVTNGIQVTPTANTTSDVNEDVTVNYKANGSPCTAKTFKIRHNGAGCSCAILSFKVNGSVATSIAWDSEASGRGEGDANVKTITYSIVSGKENCINGSINVDITGTDADKFGVDKTDPTSVKVWPIGENTEDRELSAKIAYSYELIDGTECDGSYDFVTITQIKGCKCVNIMPGQCYQKTVTKLGGNDFPIGSGATQGCGIFSYRQKGEGVSYVHIYHDGEYKRRFTVDLKNMSLSTKRDIVNDITIVFTKEYNGKPIGECSTVYTIIQTPDWVSCNRLDDYSMTGEEIPYYLSEREFRIWRTNVYYVVQAFMAYQNQGVITASEMTSDKDWLHDFRINSHYDDIDATNRYYEIYAKADPNTGTQDRTATVTLTMNRTKLTELGICRCSTYTKTFTVTQKASSQPSQDCDCQEYPGVPFTYNAKAEEGQTEVRVLHEYPATCFTESIQHRFTLTDENGNLIDNCYSDYKAVPNYSWLSVKIEDYAFTETTYAPKLYWKWQTNDYEDPRTGVYYFVVNLANGETCKRRVEITQKGKLDLSCTLLKDSISEGVSPIPNNGSTEHSVAWTSSLLVEGSHLTGEKTSSTASWINSLHTKTNDATHLYADAKSNISTLNDGASLGRETTIKTYFVDGDGNKVVIDDEECPTKTITVHQNGFSGKCPSCDSVTIDDLEIMYTDENGHYYGDEENGCVGIDGDSYPAVHGGFGVILFKCKINKPTTVDHEGHTTTCFEVMPETTDGNLTRVWAVLDTTDTNKQTYIIKGNLNYNSGNAHVGVGMALYIGRKNYAGDTEGTPVKCTSFKDAHIILLVNNKKCDYTPIN